MSYQQERDEFIAAAAKRGLRVDQARAILSKAATLDRLAVAQCNGDWPADNGERETKACPLCESHWVPSTIKRAGCPDCRAEASVRKALNGSGAAPEFHGDPRGCVLKIRFPDGSEFGVPVRS